MTPRSWIRALFFTLAAALSTVGFAQPARAGSLGVRDETHALSAGDRQRLSDVLTAAPFDGRVVVTTQYADARDLSRYVASLVVEPNLVVVGLDPEHHHVQVHFGTAAGIPRADWPDIERAGNDAFRRADWAGGVGAIFARAASDVTGSSSPVQPQLAPSTRPSMFGPVVLLLVLAGAVVVVGLVLSRRRAAMGGYDGYGPPASYGPGPGYYGGPGYGPTGGGIGPVGGGLIGAGLGGLAGYELGKVEGEREERDREGPNQGDEWGGSGGGSSDGNFDDGGGGSSWDDGSGDDGSGGGGSDF
jgi:hypothetical protein